MAPPVGEGDSRTRGLYPVGGRRALEDDLPLRRRMHEAEPRGVQTEPPDVAPGADVGHVAADRPARLGGRPALDQRQVHALDVPRLELRLERPLRLLGLGEDEQPGRLAIEPVHDERPLPLGRQVVPEQAVRGAIPLAVGGDREEAGRLDHDEDRVVLVHEREAAREGHGAPRGERDGVAGGQRETAVAGRLPIDLHAPRLEPLLEAPARGLRVERAQPLEQRHSLRSTPSGRRPSRRRVPRKPTSRASTVAVTTPPSSVPGAQRQGTSSAKRSTAQARTAASALPASPAAAPRSAYSTAKTRETKPRVAPSAFRITDW